MEFIIDSDKRVKPQFSKTVEMLFDKLPILSTPELFDVLMFIYCIIKLRQEQEKVLSEIVADVESEPMYPDTSFCIGMKCRYLPMNRGTGFTGTNCMRNGCIFDEQD